MAMTDTDTPIDNPNKIYLDNAIISGESEAPGYEDQTEIIRIDMSITNPIQRSNGAPNTIGASKHSGLRLTKFTCLGSPDIIKHVSSGVPIGDCTLTFVKSTEGWAKYRTMVLSSVRITEYQMLDSRGFDREAFEKPTECFVLNYNEISDTVHKFGFAGTDDGQNSMTYNILNNEAS